MKAVINSVGTWCRSNPSGYCWRIRPLSIAVFFWVALTQAVYPFPLQAQTPQETADRDDRMPLRVRYPEPGHLHDLQTDHDYQYDHDTAPPENPMARFWTWLMRKISSFLSSESYKSVWQYVLLAAIAGAAIHLLIKAEVLGFLFPGKAKSTGLSYENESENIHEIDFDAALDEAIGQRNFRVGVRLLYLKTLKLLTDTGRIDYTPDKTNRQFVHELANSPLQPDFEWLTSQFELIWYGNTPIDETRFISLQKTFFLFNTAQQQPAG